MNTGQVTGERVASAKLTESDVREIRRLVKTDGIKLIAVAAAFGISPGHCSQIVSGKVWRSLKD